MNYDRDDNDLTIAHIWAHTKGGRVVVVGCFVSHGFLMTPPPPPCCFVSSTVTEWPCGSRRAGCSIMGTVGMEDGSLNGCPLWFWLWRKGPPHGSHKQRMQCRKHTGGGDLLFLSLSLSLLESNHTDREAHAAAAVSLPTAAGAAPWEVVTVEARPHSLFRMMQMRPCFGLIPYSIVSLYLCIFVSCILNMMIILLEKKWEGAREDRARERSIAVKREDMIFTYKNKTGWCRLSFDSNKLNCLVDQTNLMLR